MVDPVVVGGGAAGLTAGIALHREGSEPTVYEREARPDDQPEGLVIGTNGLRVLDHLGLADRVRTAGQPIERARLLDADGLTLTELDFAGFEGQIFGQTPVSVTREDLLEALRSALPSDAFERGRECAGAAHQGGRELVQFADGDAVPASLVVGADGLRSAVRGSMFPDLQLQPTGWYAYRGIAGEWFAAHLRPVAWQVWGPRTRVSFAALGADRVGWTVVVDDTVGSAGEPEQLLTALSERCTGWPEPVRTLFARTEPGTIRVDPLMDFRPLDRWHGEAIALVGDAAHASVPGLWQGVGLAMADAYTLVDRLRGVDSIPGVLTAYEADRKPIADWAARRARQLLRVSTLERAPFRWGRNRLLRLSPASFTRRARRRLASIG